MRRRQNWMGFATSQVKSAAAKRREAAYDRQQKARRKATRADEEASDRYYSDLRKRSRTSTPKEGRTRRKLSGIFHELYGRNPRFRKAVDEITDRAKRYRANQVKPAGRKRCAYGHRMNPCQGPLGVNHRDGDESNGVKSNLNWACKRHNAQLAIYHKAMGKGVRTRQYNPGAGNLAQYVQAAVEHTRGAHDAGGRVIHETPKAKRRSFAREIAFRKTGSYQNPTRKQLINLIRTAAAEDDKATLTRLYIENRISREAFNQAVQDGRNFGSFVRQRDKNPVSLLTKVFPPDRFVVRRISA